ncbi:Histone transcription regulator 3 [Extremus antarcticus]|uniref:Histone transcription regulator 3 homolog n=1 Tax=Extremus antarcticus TaxID=702011 RepID=A0AAJ0DBR4_9PEZI|nr:Histone transcription regulator 3 [Extremus antarcticus]
MPGFKALNIESDDESDIEIDDTKELQIEDALKLYQTALKYHAEGPDFYDQAAEAYQELFQSDIFKYPESQTELRRIELYGPVTETEDLWQDDFPPGAVVATGGFDAGPSTLPQILHLSHKNYAQFKLEYLTSRLDMLHVSLNQILSDATAALDHFSEALDKDDGDLDLWRRTASVGEMLDSRRVARYCLEAVLDGDEDALGNVLSLPGLDEGLAGEQLRRLTGQLEDELSVLQSPQLRGKRKLISKRLKQRLDDYHRISDHQAVLKTEIEPAPFEPSRVVLQTPNTWAEVGEILLRQLIAEQHGTVALAPAAAVMFDQGNKGRSNLPSLEQMTPPLRIEAKPQISNGDTMPTTINEQFPGLDGGRPTAQPQIAPADVSMEVITSQANSKEVNMTDGLTVSLPTRKRSGDVAGLNDTAEEGRAKSKRTRLRESAVDDSRQAIIDANIQWEYEQQINEIQAADDWMFETVGNLFERIGIIGFQAGREVRQELQSPGKDEPPMTNGVNHGTESMKLAKSDLQAFLLAYSDSTANNFLAGGDTLDIGQGASVTGLGGSASKSTPTGHGAKPATLPNNGLAMFVREVNDGWLLTREAAWKWMCLLLRPNILADSSTYCGSTWPEDLKTMVVRTLVNFDEAFLEEANLELDTLNRHASMLDTKDAFPSMVQAIFELHLDIYCLIKEPNSGVDAATVGAQRDRLQRWSELAREAMYHRASSAESQTLDDELSIRFLWATAFNLGASPDVTQDHVIECLNDLRVVLDGLDETRIHLQNNAIMPEISLVAVDRELSRLTTKDFFLKVTSQDQSHPETTIRDLEPLLMSLDSTVRSDETTGGDINEHLAAGLAVSPDLVHFLQRSDISVRMLLWQRLRDVYVASAAGFGVVSCHFIMIRMLISELKSGMLWSMPQHERQGQLLKVLKLIGDMISKTWELVHKSDDAFEYIDEHALRNAVSSLGDVLQLLQVFNVANDSIRVGQRQPPTLANGSATPTFAKLSARVQDMQVHIWLLLYSLLDEGTHQFTDLFPNDVEDKFDFLRTVHRNLGLRGICGNMNKLFVHTLKDEFVHMVHIEGYDSEQAQVLYDLYGLNCFLNPSYELIEHNCQHDAFIEKSVALQAVDLLIQQASKLPTKDLIKHPIKDTIEKVHGSAPRKKPTEAIQRNRDIYRTFLKSPINPMNLFKCLKGEGNHITTSYVPREDAILSSKGWYFLMGHLALAKFRAQKRTGPTPTEDVDIAIAFFLQDLEYTMDKWETWFRLAQAYDTKIEESVVWSAEKLNNSMPEIVHLQRATINCYTMATALAYRSANLDDEATSEKMIEMFIEFGTRLYASSREPFSMQPFALEGEEKFFSPVQTAGVSKGQPFKPVRVYTAWKLAKVLYQRALSSRPHSWVLQFMLGKCLWKMHAASDFVKTPQDVPPTAQQVVASFVKVIELIPDEKKKDSREKREPVLEPHYKLVSIVHKLVSRGELGLDEAKEALSNSPYARIAEFPDDLEGWIPYILDVLQTLRINDKSNWHHRMIHRAARIVYDDSDDHAVSQDMCAKAAKLELTKQMFTKTMVLNVWRPDSERAGRHFVYTARYTRFFVQILEQLKDRSNLEMLARRVRRRPHEIFEHSIIWQEICQSYLRLLRNYAMLQEGLETSTFSNSTYDEFLARKDPLEKWMQAQEVGTSSALDVLREVQELKKINAGLTRPSPIDDLIGDAYAYLFNTVGRQLLDEQQRVKREEEASRPAPIAASPPRNPMMSLTHLMNVDGTSEAAATAALPQPAASSLLHPDQAPARRKIGVGRREIRTCAEASSQKAASSASKLPITYPRVQVVIDTSAVHAGDISAATSAPGSIHDSADDESELSELEEEADDEGNGGTPIDEEARPRMMFPGLASTQESREGSEGFETAEEEVGADIGEGGVRQSVETREMEVGDQHQDERMEE